MPRSGILLTGVEDSEDPDRILSHPIDDDIIGMHDRLAGPVDAAGSVRIRRESQVFGCMFDAFVQSFGSVRVSIGDIGDDLPQIATSFGKPA